MYTGWRCPRCYRKSHNASGGNRRATLRTFQASSALHAATSPIVAHGISEHYDDPRICSRCGYLTTTHPCTYCGKD
jgi:recombinational DNA repair protein RecR